MEIAQIKDVLKSKPFRPFLMRMVDGREFSVPHPEFVYVPPSMRHTVLFSNNQTGAVTILDAIMIASIEFSEPDGTPDLGNGHGADNGNGVA